MTVEELENYEIEEHREPFVVDSDDKAAWAMRKFCETVRKIEANEAMVEKEKARWRYSLAGNGVETCRTHQ